MDKQLLMMMCMMMMMWMMLNEADVDEMPAHGQDDFSAWLQLVAIPNFCSSIVAGTDKFRHECLNWTPEKSTEVSVLRLSSPRIPLQLIL